MTASDTVNIFNGFAYVVSKNENACSASPCSSTNESNDNGNGNALSIFNVGGNNATSPVFDGSISDASERRTARCSVPTAITVTKIGGTSYALVAAQGCIQGSRSLPVSPVRTRPPHRATTWM